MIYNSSISRHFHISLHTSTKKGTEKGSGAKKAVDVKKTSLPDVTSVLLRIHHAQVFCKYSAVAALTLHKRLTLPLNACMVGVKHLVY